LCARRGQLEGPGNFVFLLQISHCAAFHKQAPNLSTDQGGGKRRSDFVSVNLDDGSAAIPKALFG
jgi:hypothetical protein